MMPEPRIFSARTLIHTTAVLSTREDGQAPPLPYQILPCHFLGADGGQTSPWFRTAPVLDTETTHESDNMLSRQVLLDQSGTFLWTRMHIGAFFMNSFGVEDQY